MNKKHLTSAEVLRYATQLEASGSLPEAASAYAAILRKFPKHPKARAGLIRVEKSTGPAQALTQQDTSRLKNLQVLLGQGKFTELRDEASKLIGRYPALAFVPNIAGIALAQLGQHKSAIKLFREALTRDETYGPAHVNLSTSLRITGDSDAALQSATAALKLLPGNVEVLVTHGLALFASNQPELAKRELEAALKINPRSLEAYDGLCLIAEGLSELDDLESTIQRATATFGDDIASLQLWQGILEARNDRPNDALYILDAIPSDDLPIEKMAKYHEQRGKCLDKIGRYSEAFDAFSIANNFSISRSGTGSGQNSYLAQLRTSLHHFKTFKFESWRPQSLGKSGSNLAFLVGFPRSGTTLLDTFLRGHPEIEVVEECPMLINVIEQLNEPNNIKALANLSDEKVGELQEAYFDALGRYCPDQDFSNASVIVDKLPLNMNEVPLIRRIFPSARFLFALRHPCDCILSGYMQSFKSNIAMDTFLTLENAAELYDLSMSNWRMAVELLKVPHVTVRYESLIENTESQVMPVIEHLRLDWASSLLDHTTTALSRGVISTPSREQVTRPLYLRSRYRWRNYEAQLSPVMDKLNPWISYWGYDVA